MLSYWWFWNLDVLYLWYRPCLLCWGCSNAQDSFIPKALLKLAIPLLDLSLDFREPLISLSHDFFEQHCQAGLVGAWLLDLLGKGRHPEGPLLAVHTYISLEGFLQELTLRVALLCWFLNLFDLRPEYLVISLIQPFNFSRFLINIFQLPFAWKHFASCSINESVVLLNKPF